MKANLTLRATAALILFSLTSCGSIDPAPPTRYVFSHTGKGSVRAVR